MTHMLVLTRSLQGDAEPGSDSIDIGPDVRVTILGIKGKQVRIGIEAPREVTVLRSELRPETPDERKRRLAR
jgi:carbon storage regulator